MAAGLRFGLINVAHSRDCSVTENWRFRGLGGRQDKGPARNRAKKG